MCASEVVLSCFFFIQVNLSVCTFLINCYCNFYWNKDGIR